MPYFINEKCTRCAACLAECPTQSITPGRTHYIIDADTCSDHKACVTVCPVNAIHPLEVHLASTQKVKPAGKPAAKPTQK